MVYYGALSKGCQRCRQRKVKCDLRKPCCQKCESFKAPCPGYRRLDDLMFRDESSRITKRASQGLKPDQERHRTATKFTSEPLETTPAVNRSTLLVQFSLGATVREHGAQYFFSHYAYNEPTFAHDFRDWLEGLYRESDSDSMICSAVDAIGLGGLSNTFLAPKLAARSTERYGRALSATKEALYDPSEVTSDTTFMAIILLGMFEFVNFEFERYENWAAHVRAAAAILELRGPEQFERERGGQLFVHIRSQILSYCVKERAPVPPPLIRAKYNFDQSIVRQSWQARKIASPGSICEISFRVVNLRAAVKTKQVTDPKEIYRQVQDIEDDLTTWRDHIPSSWQYLTIPIPDGRDALTQTYQKYPTAWSAWTWDHWRTLRLLLNQILLLNDYWPPSSEAKTKVATLATIRKISTDMCISTSSCMDSPRMMSLIEPLHCIAKERSNLFAVREFAVGQLRRIAASIGVRQASRLADTAVKRIEDDDRKVQEAFSKACECHLSL